MAASWMETAYCRCFQAVIKAANYFLGYRMPQCLEGPGKIRELGSFLAEKGIQDILVVTGSGMVRRGQVQPMLDGFDANGIRYFVQAYDHSDPTSQDVELGYKAYRDHGCKAIAALGGGSRIDCAKGIAVKVVHPRKNVVQMQGILKVLRPIPTLIAIPTTAGAGSETTLAAVITDADTHRKASINDPFLIPKYAVLDPELTLGLPASTTAATGMDALSHAVESYVNHTYCTVLEKELSRKAVMLIYENLLTAVENGSDLEARQAMQKAAFYAGRAFTRGCVGYVHAVGHTLGGLYGVSHGVAMAVLLPKVMGQYGAKAHKRLDELAAVCGFQGTDQEKAAAFLGWIEDMNQKMGLPSGFSCIREEDIPRMIAWAKKEANPLYPVPVVWGDEDFKKLIRSLRI